LDLEYKESPAADIAGIDELASDVASFANAAGGQILIGIKEGREGKSKTGIPESIDAGVDLKVMTIERLDQLLSAKIRPPISGLVIMPIHLTGSQAVLVIDVPAPGPLAPHQAPDHVYYRRQNRRRSPMYDHEIKLLMNRTTLPDLSLQLGFYPTHVWTTPLQTFSTANAAMPGFQLSAALQNQSWQPPLHWLVEVLVDPELEVIRTFEFIDRGMREGLRSFAMNSQMGVFPPFRTAPIDLGAVVRLGIRTIQGDASEYRIRWIVACPGQSLECDGIIERRGQSVSITMEEPRSIA
jgi:hypothetical protein